MMIEIPKSIMGVAAGVAGLLVGYCIYFDRKRHQDPDFKKKLHEKRQKKRQLHERQNNRNTMAPPKLNDVHAAQQYFVQQIQLGEELLSIGEIEKGIDHFCNAITYCGQPPQLLEVLQQSLPAPLFSRLLEKLPDVMARVSAQQDMRDDDLE